jgi:hypothetical protein
MTTPNPTSAPPGTEVLCVLQGPEFGGFTIPIKGAVYTVREYRKSVGSVDKSGNIKRFSRPELSMLVAEIANPILRGKEPAFPCAAFRVLHRAASPSFYETQRELEDA